MTSKRPKPIKLEWSGNLLSQEPEEGERVSIKGTARQAKDEKPTLSQVARPKGEVRLRRETKGRGGKTVLVLYDFSDTASRNEASLKELCSHLKNRLACGGTVDDGKIVLQVSDSDKVTEILASMNLKAKKSGG